MAATSPVEWFNLPLHWGEILLQPHSSLLWGINRNTKDEKGEMTEDKSRQPRTENEIKQVILLRDCYHKIKHYLEDGTSTARHQLWLQSQILKSHLLTVEDVSIDKDYRNERVDPRRPKHFNRPVRKSSDDRYPKPPAGEIYRVE